MGFFEICVDALVRLAMYASVLDSSYGERNQQPLQLPTQEISLPSAPAAQGVTFFPANASATFTGCQYPSLVGWESCNTASDRGCWLNDPRRRETLYQYNISTDYEAFTCLLYTSPSPRD